MEKIIRQKIDHDKYDITRSNYKEVATDLIRLRTVYLFKENWELELECINRKWSLKEKTIANSRKGDLEELTILLSKRAVRFPISKKKLVTSKFQMKFYKELKRIEKTEKLPQPTTLPANLNNLLNTSKKYSGNRG
ncbi:hypothetical protein [Chitinophaga flava]|uniref:Uncharacterized protein n=1 Tax=Chitinophaga flava TaxID=2259036 RepID=A0A365XUM0_9BACT|nr:hypothetical protein [Chitinophaga flava]RBL90033.1 hypothetical protein DF182_26545 [Chitinophaga flava]